MSYVKTQLISIYVILGLSIALRMVARMKGYEEWDIFIGVMTLLWLIFVTWFTFRYANFYVEQKSNIKKHHNNLIEKTISPLRSIEIRYNIDNKDFKKSEIDFGVYIDGTYRKYRKYQEIEGFNNFAEHLTSRPYKILRQRMKALQKAERGATEMIRGIGEELGPIIKKNLPKGSKIRYRPTCISYVIFLCKIKKQKPDGHIENRMCPGKYWEYMITLENNQVTPVATIDKDTSQEEAFGNKKSVESTLLKLMKNKEIGTQIHSRIEYIGNLEENIEEIRSGIEEIITFHKNTSRINGECQLEKMIKRWKWSGI